MNFALAKNRGNPDEANVLSADPSVPASLGAEDQLRGVSLTLDVDWAPDFVIDYAAELLIQAGVRATWFVTHRSPALDRLRAHGDLFELGIHPNFSPGSTHGGSISSVLEHCLSMVPEAVSMRTHSLLQSSPLLAEVLHTTPIRVDVSICLPRHTHLAPVHFYSRGKNLLRIPFFWEDDIEMESPSPSWGLTDEFDSPGLKVFDFHPIHVYCNSPSLDLYSGLKQKVGLGNLTPDNARDWVHSGRGTQTFFRELLEDLTKGGDSLRISDIARTWQNKHE